MIMILCLACASRNNYVFLRCCLSQECQRKLDHKLSLDAYLLKPVQRITKYQLLLKVNSLQQCKEFQHMACFTFRIAYQHYFLKDYLEIDLLSLLQQILVMLYCKMVIDSQRKDFYFRITTAIT